MNFKRIFSVELLRKDGKTSIFELKDGFNSFEGNTFIINVVNEKNVTSIKAKINLARRFIGYSFINDFVFDETFEDALFFAPSSYYGDIHNPTKMALFNKISGAGVDMISAPIVGFFKNNKGTLIRDLTPGRRDTIADDCEIHKKTKPLVSSNFDLPGLGVKDSDGKITLEHRYPAHTYNNIRENENLCRYSNAKTARFSFEIEEKEYSSYDEFCSSSWKEEFARCDKTSNGVDTHEAIQCIINNVCDGYGYRDGIPQFCTNTDHFLRESGFLFRNTDIAAILLKYKHNSDYHVSLNDEQLIAVIDSQVDNEYCGKNQVWEFSRSRIEGVFAVLNAFETLKKIGIIKDKWFEFVKSEAEIVLKSDEYFGIPFLIHLYYCTKDNKYLQSAINKGEFIWKNKLVYNNFSGGITDFIGAPPLDKETGLLTLYGYIELYEATKDSKYLKYAKKCADYSETYTQLWNINLEPKEYDDTNEYGQCGHGNEHVNSQGLSYVSNTCGVGDGCNLFGIPYFAKLAKYSGDNHYLEFAKFAYMNAFNIVYLDDKTGGMDDYLYSSGYGYAPEYVALAGSVDGACNGRGRMHDSNIGWVLYGFLFDGYEIEVNKLFEFNNKASKRYKVIKVDKIFAYPSKFSPNNLLTGGRRVFFDIGTSQTVQLFFNKVRHVDKLVISYQDSNVECSYNIETIKDGVIRPMTRLHHKKGFYDVIYLDENVTSLRITYDKKDNLYLSGIIPFGITENVLNKDIYNDSETFVKRYVKDEVKYYIDDELIKFNTKTGTYCGDHVEFLRGGLVRVYDRRAKAVFALEKTPVLFWFRKCNVEPYEGNVKVSIMANGEKIFVDKVKDVTSYVEINKKGTIELVFDGKNKNSVEFGYLEINGGKLYG